MPGYQITATVQHSAITRKFQVPTNFTFAKFEQAFEIVFGLKEPLPAHFFIPKTNTIIVDKNLDENFRGIEPPTVKIIHTGAKLSTHLKHGPIKLIYATENNGEIIIDVVPEKVLDHFDQEFPVVNSAKKFIVGMDKPDLQKMNGALELAFSKDKFKISQVRLVTDAATRLLNDNRSLRKKATAKKNQPDIFPVNISLNFDPQLFMTGDDEDDKDDDDDYASFMQEDDYMEQIPNIQLAFIARRSEIKNPTANVIDFALKKHYTDYLLGLNFDLAQKYLESIINNEEKINLTTLQDLLHDLLKSLQANILSPGKLELVDMQLGGMWPIVRPALKRSAMMEEFVENSHFFF